MSEGQTIRHIGTKKVADTDGTWAQVTRKGNLIFISGQVGMDAKGEFPRGGEFEAQARLALDNLVDVLKAAGGSLEDLMMITVFVTDMANRPIFARVRDGYFRANPPASTIVEITRLFMEGVLVEVNGIAVLD